MVLGLTPTLSLYVHAIAEGRFSLLPSFSERDPHGCHGVPKTLMKTALEAAKVTVSLTKLQELLYTSIAKSRGWRKPWDYAD